MISRPLLSDILSATSTATPEHIGHSRDGREIDGFKFGQGELNVSLIAGCHADEPTGTIFLNHLVKFLNQQTKDSFLLSACSWWIVPQVNPDGEFNNRPWSSPKDDIFDLPENLQFARRELPGDDIEFGFPLPPHIPSLRRENQAVYDFWKTAINPFHLHVSLHGMRTAYGPWFLIDKDFSSESQELMHQCKKEVQALNYLLHDVDRKGEKGFYRLSEGFGTRPDSAAMRDYFENDPQMAQKFHASSMESIRSLGDPCLTLVTEMPLFVIPRINHDLQWPDPTLVAWSKQLQHWQLLLAKKQITAREVRQIAHAKGLQAMPLTDQMHLQWTLIWAGIEQQLKHLQLSS